MKMRIPIVVFHFCGFLFLSYSVFSQSYEGLIIINESCQDVELTKDTVFFQDPHPQAMNEEIWLIETFQPPEFPGGENALIEFFRNNMVYPEQAINDKFEGRVILTFTITPEGCIGTLRLREIVRSDIENECIRILKNLPRFKPATTITKAEKGWYWKPTTIWYGVILYFSLGNDSEKHPITIVPKTQISPD
jgi:hypothetical protein